MVVTLVLSILDWKKKRKKKERKKKKKAKKLKAISTEKDQEETSEPVLRRQFLNLSEEYSPSWIQSHDDTASSAAPWAIGKQW